MTVIAAISIIFLTWYSGQHSRDEASSRFFGPPGSVNAVLLAIDQVNVNDSLIREVIRSLESEHLTVEVYGLADLDAMKGRNWSAIVIFQKASPLPNVSNLVNQIKASTNGFVVTLHNNQICLLEGAGMRVADSLNGIGPVAEAIVRQVRLAQVQSK